MLITTVFRNLLRIYIRANTRKVTLLILHGDLMFSPQMKDRTIKIEVLLFSAKISLTNPILIGDAVGLPLELVFLAEPTVERGYQVCIFGWSHFTFPFRAGYRSVKPNRIRLQHTLYRSESPANLQINPLIFSAVYKVLQFIFSAFLRGSREAGHHRIGFSIQRYHIADADVLWLLLSLAKRQDLFTSFSEQSKIDIFHIIPFCLAAGRVFFDGVFLQRKKCGPKPATPEYLPLHSQLWDLQPCLLKSGESATLFCIALLKARNPLKRPALPGVVTRRWGA